MTGEIFLIQNDEQLVAMKEQKYDSESNRCQAYTVDNKAICITEV